MTTEEKPKNLTELARGDGFKFWADEPRAVLPKGWKVSLTPLSVIEALRRAIRKGEA